MLIKIKWIYEKKVLTASLLNICLREAVRAAFFFYNRFQPKFIYKALPANQQQVPSYWYSSPQGELQQADSPGKYPGVSAPNLSNSGHPVHPKVIWSVPTCSLFVLCQMNLWSCSMVPKLKVYLKTEKFTLSLLLLMINN